MDPNVSLRTDQIADLAVYIRDRKVLNLSDPGAGKTPPTVVFMWYLWTQESAGTVWIMPKSLMQKNKREIHRFTEFVDDDVAIIDSPTDMKRAIQRGAKVFIMGFRRFALCWKELPNYVRFVAVDELHMGFKSADSQQTQALFSFFDLRENVDWFVPMTGSIINGKLSSVYPAIHIVEPRYYPSADAFDYQHAIRDYDNKIIGWRNHDKLSEIFRRHGIRRTFESIHGSHDPIFIPEVVQMNPRQREMYDEFHEKAVLELDKFFLDGTEPGVAFIRARQLMEHPNEFPDLTRPGEFIDIMPGHTPAKEDALEVHLEHHATAGTPVIIFSSLKPQQRRCLAMLERYGFKAGLINSDTPQKRRDEIDVGYQSGDLNSIVCSPPCAGVGYNWQWCAEKETSHIIFMTVGYLDTEFSQAYKRAIRGARRLGLRVTILQYEDSLDQHVLGILYRKSVEANKVDPTYKVMQLSGIEKDYTMR